MTDRDLPKHEHDGRSLTVAEWANVTGIRTYDISMRLRQGWTITRIIAEVKPASETQAIVIPNRPKQEPVSAPRKVVERMFPKASTDDEEPTFVGYRDGAELYSWRGVLASRREWARRIGISDAALRSRVQSGWPLLKAFTQPLQPHVAQVHEHEGVTLTLSEWSQQTGISYGILACRLRTGKSIAEAIAMGLRAAGRPRAGAAQLQDAMAASKGGRPATSDPHRGPAPGGERQSALK